MYGDCLGEVQRENSENILSAISNNARVSERVSQIKLFIIHDITMIFFLQIKPLNAVSN